MIRKFESINFRMLRANSFELGYFHVLVGPNGAGKTTFLDALQLIADILKLGVPAAVKLRAPSFYDLCFDPALPISFAVEVQVESEIRLEDATPEPNLLRYEIEFGILDKNGLGVLRENLFIIPTRNQDIIQRSLFGPEWTGPIVSSKSRQPWRLVLKKTDAGTDYFKDERTDWNNQFRFGVDRAALGSLPEDRSRFPLSIAVRDMLRDGVRTLVLDARAMRGTSPPGGANTLALDGSNLPYVVRDLAERDPILFDQWVTEVSTAVEGLSRVSVREREEDRHLVLEAEFSGEHKKPIPSWMLSDGTLRLMALTLLSYSAEPGSPGVYLIEEPENGLHPLAVQTVLRTLAAPTGYLQVLCASHSPVLLANADLGSALVFGRSAQGTAIVRRADEIPNIVSWSRNASLADLLVTGILS